MNALAVPACVPKPRGAAWFALALAFALMVLPDCCLTGSHAFGFGMGAFGPICRATLGPGS